jgi:hypothetical protein
MCPFSQSDGHDEPWLRGQSFPVVAAVRDDVVVVAEDAVGQPVVAHELPDVFHDVEFGTFGWQRQQRDVGGYVERGRDMPPGLIEQQDGMLAWADDPADFGQVLAHARSVAERQNQGRALALTWADGAEDIGGGRALVLRC